MIAIAMPNRPGLFRRPSTVLSASTDSKRICDIIGAIGLLPRERKSAGFVCHFCIRSAKQIVASVLN
jgi:hypothetical protein